MNHLPITELLCDPLNRGFTGFFNMEALICKLSLRLHVKKTNCPFGYFKLFYLSPEKKKWADWRFINMQSSDFFSMFRPSGLSGHLDKGHLCSSGLSWMSRNLSVWNDVKMLMLHYISLPPVHVPASALLRGPPTHTHTHTRRVTQVEWLWLCNNLCNLWIRVCMHSCVWLQFV